MSGKFHWNFFKIEFLKQNAIYYTAQSKPNLGRGGGGVPYFQAEVLVEVGNLKWQHSFKTDMRSAPIHKFTPLRVGWG